MSRLHRRWGTSLRTAGRRRLWPTAMGFSLLALIVTTMSEPRGRYVADNRFEQYVNPARGLAKMFSIWDTSRGLGGPREDVWILTTLPPALLRGVGLSAPDTQRVFHALCLSLAATGVVALVRVFRPRIDAVHVVAGLITMLGPFTASFLVPSNLFVMFALSPWLVTIAIRGVTEDDPWRWAAAFALVVFLAGNSDVPGLLYGALAIAVAVFHVVVIERAAPWRAVGRWGARAALLATVCSAWALTKTYYASEPLDARLADTELPSASATSSSWSESLRGLGNWLSYFRDERGLTKPQTALYFEQPLMVLLTFVPVVIAFTVLWTSRLRSRLLFGAMAVLGATAMVGGFGEPSNSLLGGSVLWAFEHVRPLSSMRNTYKGAGGLVIGVAVLAAIGLVGAVRMAHRRSRALGAASAMGVALLVATLGAPFTTLSMYSPDEQSGEVPEYWNDALAFLDRDPTLRSLIVPAISQAEYRWGYVGDDIFDGTMRNAHATATGWMLSTRVGHNALEQITLAAQLPHYRPGVVGPMARRLGISMIVIRNDLDWQRLRVASPELFDALRDDDDLELVATFGNPVPDDTGGPDDEDVTRPPVEIYRVVGAVPTVTVEPLAADRAVVMSGDAGGWPVLAQSGVLGPSTDVVASASLTGDQLIDELAAGAPLLITDSNRRRVRTLLKHEPDLSPTLAPGEDRDRPVRPIYPTTAGAESVAWFADATTITGSYTALGGLRNDRRAALAFDGDPDTAWAIPFGIGGAPSVTVTLRTPTPIERVDVQTTLTPDGRPTVQLLALSTADGNEIAAETDASGRASFALDGRVADTLTLAVVDALLGYEVGLAEVSVDDLDLVEYIQVPTDATDRVASSGPELDGADIGYAFRRVARAVSSVRTDPSTTRFDEELALRRRFQVVHPTTLPVSGDVKLLSSTSDEIIADLSGGPVRIVGSRVPGVPNDRPAVLALDGDRTTWWEGGAVEDATWDVSFPEQLVSAVRLVQPHDGSTATVDRWEVTAGDETSVVAARKRTCAPSADCSIVTTIELDRPTRVAELTVRSRSIDTSAAFFPDRIRLSEIEIVGSARPSIALDAPLTDECLDLGLVVEHPDGNGATIRARVDGTASELLAGDPLPFTGCGDLELEAGTHLLRTLPGAPVDRFAAVPPSAVDAAEGARTVDVTVEHRSSDRVDLVVEDPGPVRVDWATSFDPRWELHVGDRVVRADERNAGNSWTIELTEPSTSIVLVYAPSRVLRVAVAISCVGLVGSLWLWSRRRGGDRRWRPDAPDVAPTVSRTAELVAVGAATTVGVLIAGPVVLLIGVATLVGLLLVPNVRSQIGIAPPVLLAFAGIWSAFLVADAPLQIDYAARRSAASALAAIGIAFAYQHVALSWLHERRSATASSTPLALLTGRPRLLRPSLVAVTVVAAVAGALRHVERMPPALVDNVRMGRSYTRGTATSGATDVLPAPVLLDAFAPSPTWLLGAAAATATAWSTGRLVGRWSAPTSPAPAVAAALATVATIWSADTIAQLVAIGFATSALAIAAAPPSSRPFVVPAAAGGVLAAAILSDGSAVWIAPLAVGVAWWSARSAVRIVAMLTTTFVCLVPWLQFVRSESGDLDVFVAAPVRVLVPITTAAVATIVLARPVARTTADPEADDR